MAFQKKSQRLTLPGNVFIQEPCSSRIFGTAIAGGNPRGCYEKLPMGEDVWKFGRVTKLVPQVFFLTCNLL